MICCFPLHFHSCLFTSLNDRVLTQPDNWMQTFCFPCKHGTYPRMHLCCRMSVGVERYDTQHCLKMPLVLHHIWRPQSNKQRRLQLDPSVFPHGCESVLNSPNLAYNPCGESYRANIALPQTLQRPNRWQSCPNFSKQRTAN